MPLSIAIAILLFILISGKVFYQTFAQNGHYIRGLMAAFLGTAATFVFTLVPTLPNLGSTGEHSHRSWCMNNLKQIGRALQEYAAANNDYLPIGDSLSGLCALEDSGYWWINSLSFCPSVHVPHFDKESLTKENYTYVYLGTGKNVQDVKKPEPILMDKAGNHIGYGNVLFSDGSVKGFKGEEWERVCYSAGTTLTIIRQEVGGLLNIAPVQVFLDGKAAACLSEEGHLVLKVPYGEHKLSIRYENLYKRDGIMRQTEIAMKIADNIPLSFALSPCVGINGKTAFSGEWALIQK